MAIRRYSYVSILDWALQSCAGSAVQTYRACREKRPALDYSPDEGWSGRYDSSNDLLTLSHCATELLQRTNISQTDGFPGFFISSSKGDIEALMQSMHGNDAFFKCFPPGSFAKRLAKQLGIPFWHGTAPVAACSTGLYTLLALADSLEDKQCTIGMAGCADGPLSPLLLAAYKNMGVACSQQPSAFTGAGGGFAPAQGAAFTILSHNAGPWMLRCGVRIGDACHETRCDNPESLRYCLNALWDATPHPDLIITHATGTRTGDAYEQSILDEGPWATCERLICKPYIGHCLGASGLVELAAGLEAPVQRIWKISLGFGGHIAAISCERTEK